MKRKNIRETVEKSGGVMDIDTKGQRFTLTVLLYINRFLKENNI